MDADIPKKEGRGVRCQVSGSEIKGFSGKLNRETKGRGKLQKGQ